MFLSILFSSQKKIAKHDYSPEKNAKILLITGLLTLIFHSTAYTNYEYTSKLLS